MLAGRPGRVALDDERRVEAGDLLEGDLQLAVRQVAHLPGEVDARHPHVAPRHVLRAERDILQLVPRRVRRHGAPGGVHAEHPVAGRPGDLLLEFVAALEALALEGGGLQLPQPGQHLRGGGRRRIRGERSRGDEERGEERRWAHESWGKTGLAPSLYTRPGPHPSRRPGAPVRPMGALTAGAAPGATACPRRAVRPALSRRNQARHGRCFWPGWAARRDGADRSAPRPARRARPNSSGCRR